MKKITLLFAVVFSCVFLAGCGDKPEKVVTKFANAVKKQDYKTAADCVANVSESEIESKCDDNSLRKAFSSMKPIAVKIDGNEAKVTVEWTQEVEVPLKKVNGDWKMKI